jgi:hypothetical protein
LKAGHKYHGESSLLIVESNWFVPTLILPCRLKLQSFFTIEGSNFDVLATTWYEALAAKPTKLIPPTHIVSMVSKHEVNERGIIGPSAMGAMHTLHVGFIVARYAIKLLRWPKADQHPNPLPKPLQCLSFARSKPCLYSFHLHWVVRLNIEM